MEKSITPSRQYNLTTITKDPQDDNDYLYEWASDDVLPTSVDLREYTSTVENQLSVGSCTANATVGAAEMFLVANGAFKDTEATEQQDLSRLFNYYTSRTYFPIEYQQNDWGSIARCSLKAAKNFGICSELSHTYNVSKWNEKPSDAAFKEALENKVGAYYRIPLVGDNWAAYPTAKAVKHALAKGFPVLVGMQVGEKIRSLKPSEEYPYVHPTNNPLIGGHEMLIVGYTADDKFIVRNSWGKEWCDGGHFNCPQGVLVNDAMDLWVMQGFAGYTSIGADLTKPAEIVPEPAPISPVEKPLVEPPIEDKPSVVVPEPEKNNTPIIIVGVIVLAAIVAYSQGWLS